MEQPVHALDPRRIGTLLVAAALCGCSASAPTRRPPQAISLADFAPAGAAPAAATPPAPAPQAPVRAQGAVEASEGLIDAVASPGPPAPLLALGAGDARPISPSVLVDAKIGDINGKPIYANEFLDPMGKRLSDGARDRPSAEWRAWARQQIARELLDRVKNELLLAEALSSFTPEQKQGFFAFMETIQKNLQREHGGTRTQAESSLQREGKTLEEWRRQTEDEQLVALHMQERIGPRLNVSYRDIRQRYEQFAADYSKPPQAVFRLVQIPKDKPADVEAFREKLAAGETFEAAAKDPMNLYKPAEGGLELRDIVGDRAQGDFFPNPALNEAARTVEPGKTAGPIELSETIGFLHLERIRQRAVSLYDAQLALNKEIFNARVNGEIERYVASLSDRASITSMDEMVNRLLGVAEQRFLVSPAGRAP